MGSEPVSAHVSIVSHGHGQWLTGLLADLDRTHAVSPVRVTLTLNVPERLSFDERSWALPLTIVRNVRPRGFGANHNAAFLRRQEQATHFCVANPDVRLGPEVLPRLIDDFVSHADLGMVGPAVVDSRGRLQNSARKLPTPARVARRALGALPSLDYPAVDGCRSVDWVAGMLMVVPGAVFSHLGGFDERYFLYYEDVDLCCRARLAGYDVGIDRSVCVTHNGLWSSHRDVRHLGWHVASMVRFFRSRGFRQLWRRRAAARLRWPARASFPLPPGEGQ